MYKSASSYQKALSRFEVNQVDVSMIVALEVCDGSEVSVVGNTAHIQFCALKVNNLRQCINGRQLSCLGNQIQEELFFMT